MSLVWWERKRHGRRSLTLNSGLLPLVLMLPIVVVVVWSVLAQVLGIR
jgi:hypothetical protein